MKYKMARISEGSHRSIVYWLAHSPTTSEGVCSNPVSGKLHGIKHGH